MSLNPIRFENNKVYVLDQLLLPHETKEICLQSSEDSFNVIKDMNVRGAPLIGFTGLYGLAFSVKESNSFDELSNKLNFLKSARPTAVNLAFEIDSCFELIKKKFNEFDQNSIYQFALNIAEIKIKKLEEDNRSTANFLIKELQKKYPQKNKFNILTICNTGRLACGALGTALGAIVVLKEYNLLNEVYACETRPYLQGSRLTAYEMVKENINHFIIPDGAISHVLKKQQIDAVFVGADRIAINGDTANKIGTSNLGIIAKFYNVPFYVVAPLSSFDFDCPNGESIEIEMRNGEELLKFKGEWISPIESKGFNPAFDVTDHQFITGVACEKGVFSPNEIRGLI